jgi:asparagine synthase (glutamine-hydrolysing)
MTSLNLADKSSNFSDSDILFAAYQEWGENCPKYILGDFSFAIYDSSTNLVFCARDHFGIKPFYYFLDDQYFAFASEESSLLELEFVSTEINELRLGEFIVGQISDKTTTFYKNIFRLPPAHSITVTLKESAVTKYWKLHSPKSLSNLTDQEYIDQFQSLFRQAVESRLDTNEKVGGFLSGGLDSSSIAAVASEIQRDKGVKFSTVSAVFSEIPECDERKYISKTSKKLGLDSYIYECSGINPFGEFEELTNILNSPVANPGLYRLHYLLKKAKSVGIKVMLDGHDGDSTVSHGLGILNELAKSGQYLELAQNCIGVAKVFGLNPVEIFFEKTKLSCNFVLKIANKLFNKISKIHNIWDKDKIKSSKNTVWNHLHHKLKKSLELHLLGLREQVEKSNSLDELEAHIESLSNPMQPFVLETLDKMAAANGIEMRYPFYDKRLVEFCIATPPHLKMYNGKTRVILRKAIKEYLPDIVTDRINKTNFSPIIVRDTNLFSKVDIKHILGMRFALTKELVDSKGAKDSWDIFQNYPTSDNLDVLFPVLAVMVWLYTSQKQKK